MPPEAMADRPNSRGGRTRAALLGAGLRLFSERQVDAVSIDEIVGLAGVAKGSFFNHFEDKQRFANAIAADIRLDLERRVGAANAEVADPVERLAGGMLVATGFALTERERTLVMLRGQVPFTLTGHPLNDGLRADIEASCRAGRLRPEARSSGLLLWLAACQIVMAATAVPGRSRRETARRMREIMTMALIGLGEDETRAAETARRCERRLLASADPGETG